MLAFVVVYNLLEVDFEEKERLEEIEKAINLAMSSIEGLEATDDNMCYSFPRDPSVKSATIPVMIEVKLFPIPNVNGEIRRVLERRIRNAFVALDKQERARVVVTVQSIDPDKDGFGEYRRV